MSLFKERGRRKLAFLRLLLLLIYIKETKYELFLEFTSKESKYVTSVSNVTSLYTSNNENENTCPY
jgi:hypothetical protein